MRNLFILPILLNGMILFQTSLLAEEKEQELKISTSLIIKKLAMWGVSNLNLRKATLANEYDEINTSEFINQALNFFQQEKIPFSQMQLVFTAIKEIEHEWYQNNLDYLVNYVSLLEYSLGQKEQLLDLLKNNFVHQIRHFSKSDEEPPSFNLVKAFKQLKTWLKKLPSSFMLKNDLIISADVIKKVLLANILDDDCYNTDSDCQFDGNKGIIYFQSEKIKQNLSVALCSLKIGVRVDRYYQDGKWDKNPLFNQKQQKNFWPEFLELCGSNPLLTLESMAVFGHDVCCNKLKQDRDFPSLSIKLNNLFRPNQHSKDEQPNSPYYQNGALGETVLSKQLIKKVARKLKAFRDYHINDEEYDEKNFKLRLGYHHVYGGMLMAVELIKAGVNSHQMINLPILLPQMLGYAYKKLQTWDYLSEDARLLYQRNNFNELKKRYKYPKSWSKLRRKKAKANLEYFLTLIEYTEKQHRLGAKFAFRMLSKK